MEIKVNTKFDVGQKVYTYKKDLSFKNGIFINILVPNNEVKEIVSINIEYDREFRIYYTLKGGDMIYENKLFSSKEEVITYCDKYE